MKKAVAAVAAFGPNQSRRAPRWQPVAIELDGQAIALEPADVLIQRTPKAGLAVASSGALVVALETELTPALVQEGHARELINRIQNQRKEKDLDVADRIALTIQADADLLAAIEAHRETIAAETLAVQRSMPSPAPATSTSTATPAPSTSGGPDFPRCGPAAAGFHTVENSVW
jgi:isoleucyl-tRNA synthetase